MIVAKQREQKMQTRIASPIHKKTEDNRSVFKITNAMVCFTMAKASKLVREAPNYLPT